MRIGMILLFALAGIEFALVLFSGHSQSTVRLFVYRLKPHFRLQSLLFASLLDIR